MFIKPQIMSTPHLVAPLGDAAANACQSGFAQCPSGFGGSCTPWSGKGCIDATYVDPVAVGGIIVVGAIVGGGIVVVAK